MVEAGNDVDILLLAHRHYSFMFNCFFENVVIQLMANVGIINIYIFSFGLNRFILSSSAH